MYLKYIKHIFIKSNIDEVSIDKIIEFGYFMSDLG